MTAIHRILVAADLSPPSDAALERAAGLAVAHDAELMAIIVVEPVRRDAAAGDWLWPEGGAPERIEEELRREAEEALRKRLTALAPGARIGATRAVVGVPFVEIIRHARSHAATLIVLGAHGRHYMHDLLLGTTAERVVRKGRMPVLVVKQPPEQPYGRVLLPVDFSDACAEAMRFAQRFAPAAKHTVLHVYEFWFEERFRPTLLDDHERVRVQHRYETAARERLRAFVGTLGIAEHSALLVVSHGYPAKSIVDAAGKHHADLVVIGTRGATGVPYIMLGSVAEHVMREAPCDVLIVPPAATEFELP